MGLKAEIIGGPYDGQIVDTSHYDTMAPWLYMPAPKPRVRSLVTEVLPPASEFPRNEIHKKRLGDDGQLYYVHISHLRKPV